MGWIGKPLAGFSRAIPVYQDDARSRRSQDVPKLFRSASVVEHAALGAPPWCAQEATAAMMTDMIANATRRCGVAPQGAPRDQQDDADRAVGVARAPEKDTTRGRSQPAGSGRSVESSCDGSTNTAARSSRGTWTDEQRDDERLEVDVAFGRHSLPR